MKEALAFLLLSLVAAGPAASQCMGNASATQRGVLKAQKPVLLLAQSVGPAVVATEMDLSDLLMQRVREAARLGLFSREINKTRTKIKEIAREPVSLSLPPAIKEKTHRVPMMSEENLKELSPELRDHLLRESRCYVFFDASRESEASWAAALARQDKSVPVRLIATRGDRIAFEKSYGLPLFADQGGVYVRRFAIRALPSVVTLTAREAQVTAYPVGVAP